MTGENLNFIPGERCTTDPLQPPSEFIRYQRAAALQEPFLTKILIGKNEKSAGENGQGT